MKNLETRYISPKQDFVFKELFGKEENKDLLKYVLSAILNMKEEEIKDIQINDSEFIQKQDKTGIRAFDVYATLNHEIDVQIQLFHSDDRMKRGMYHWSIMHQNELRKDIKKWITIIISDNNLTNSNKSHSTYRIKEDTKQTLYNDQLEIHVIELKKLKFDDTDNKNNEDFYSIMEFLNSKSMKEAKNLAEKNSKMAHIIKTYEELLEEESICNKCFTEKKRC